MASHLSVYEILVIFRKINTEIEYIKLLGLIFFLENCIKYWI